MNPAKLWLVILALLAAPDARAAGFRTFEIPAEGGKPAISGAMWYPCAEPSGKIELKGITIDGAKDCPIKGSRLPLVVFSHGNLGAFYDHYDTAQALADAGFVVAAITHRGDNLPTLADAADPSVMFERPHAITRLIDFMLTESPAALVIDADRIGFFGFSAGASTGLMLAGAVPDWSAMLCRFSPSPLACKDTLQNDFRLQRHPPEARIKAAVLADPGMWSDTESIAAIRIPIQLWQSEYGGRGLPNIAVAPERVAAIERHLHEPHEYHVVPLAGHFAFMLCGPSISPIPQYCADGSGFDRAAFHQDFNKQVIRFLQSHLGRRGDRS